jgi:hypothetical protein
METKEKKSKGSYQEDKCLRDSEDALFDLNKMTPEEVEEYLYSLLRDRSFGC